MASFIPYLVVLVAISAHTVSALNCYTCNSQESTSCGWGITSFTFPTATCTSAGFLDSVVGPKCYKITARGTDGKEFIARGCQNPPAFGCDAIAKTLGWFSSDVSNIDCTTCETDKCNSASKMAGFTFLGVLLATLAFLF